MGVGLSEVNFIRTFLESSSSLNEDQNTVRNTEIGERLTGNGTLCWTLTERCLNTLGVVQVEVWTKDQRSALVYVYRWFDSEGVMDVDMQKANT